jgi:hypothetical protein
VKLPPYTPLRVVIKPFERYFYLAKGSIAFVIGRRDKDLMIGIAHAPTRIPSPDFRERKMSVFWLFNLSFRKKVRG